MTAGIGPRPDRAMRVVWTRGDGCAELAEALDPSAVRVTGDLSETVLVQRADLLVRKKVASGFDLVSTAVPSDLDLDTVAEVAALVSGGPHSVLGAAVAAQLGQSLSVPARMACAYAEDPDDALTTVEQLYRQVPTIEYSIIHAEKASDLLEHLADHTLVVVGAPGGGWMQRQFFGPGARLVAKARAGAVVVQAAPRRVFSTMGEPEWVSRHLGAGDATRLHMLPLIPVVEDGILIGSVERSSLLIAGDGARVEHCMGEPVAVKATDSAEAAEAISLRYGGAAVPVVDPDGRLVGLFEPGG